MFSKGVLSQASNVCAKVKICNDISVFRKITQACGPAFPLEPCARTSAMTGVPNVPFLGQTRARWRAGRSRPKFGTMCVIRITT